MKGFLILVLVIIVAVIVLGSTVAHDVVSELGVDIGDGNSNPINKILNKANEFTTSKKSNSAGSSDDSIIDDIGEVVSDELKFNEQNGGGYYREVTYKDGGFRQYDSESGELIGSSYDSDQDKLPSME